MKISFVNLPIEYYSPVAGGALSTITMHNAQELLRQGYDVCVHSVLGEYEPHQIGQVVEIAYPQRSQLNLAQRAISRLKCKLGKWDWPFYDHYLDSLRAGLRTEKPDVVISFNDLNLARYIRQDLPRARIYSFLQNEYWAPAEVVQRADRALDGFITCSDYVGQWMAQKYQIDRARFTTVHSGVDLSQFPAQPRPAAGAGAVKALFIGRIDRNKGPDLALDAIAQLRQEGVAITATIAGAPWFYKREGDQSDPYLEEILKKTEAVGGSYLGHVPRCDVPALFRQHDIVFVLSRSNEPFGLVVLEAMASGCAVIASNRGGLPEACGEAAILVDPDSLADVVAATRSLATQPHQLARLQRLALERARKEPWSVSAGKLQRLWTPAPARLAGKDAKSPH